MFVNKKNIQTVCKFEKSSYFCHETYDMVRIETSKDAEQGAKNTKYVKCPCCGQILFDIEHIKGIVQVRSLCRRCRTYIKVDIVGN